MNDEEAKKIAEIMTSAINSRLKLEYHERPVSARECEVKHSQIMNVIRGHTGKMEAIHNDLKNVQGKINGHVAWHDGIKEEKSDASIKLNLKWAKVGTIAKWAAIVISILTVMASGAYVIGKISSISQMVERTNGD